MNTQHRRPRLESMAFGGDTGIYARMARVLDYTARRCCPGWAIDVRSVVPAPVKDSTRRDVFVANTQKLAEWWRTIMDASMGDRILLIDADTFITNPLDDIWDRDFELAYTVRPFEFPFNTGVVFLRVTPKTQAFVDLWWRETERMLCDRDHHLEWCRRFGGITQASLGYVLTRVGDALNLLELPCAEWNCEDSTWHDFAPEVTRIVHVKSALRRRVFGIPGKPLDPSCPERVLADLADRWHALEQDALAEAAVEAGGRPPRDAIAGA